MGFFQNLKDDLTSTIDDIAIKEEQGAAPSDTQSLLDLLKSEEFVEAINADEKEDDDSDEIKNVSDNSASEIEKQADAMLLGLEEVAAVAEVEETVEEVSEATEEVVEEVVEELAEVVEETSEAIDESVEESEEVAEETTAEIVEETTDEVLEDDGDSIDVLAEASLDDTLEDIMESAEEVTKESSVRDALNSLRNASLRYEQQLKNQDVDGMFLFANEEADKEAIEEAEEDNELEDITEEVEEVAEETAIVKEETAEITEEISISPVIDEPYKGVSEEVAVIATGMVISGDVSSDGNMELLGTINGNINIAGKLSVSGKVKGNIKANDIFVDGAELEGNIETTESVKIGNGSVIIGNIKSAAAIVAGAVKGDIDVKGPVILDSSAIIMGNIKSMSVQINNGAVVEGMCSQCYAQVNPTDFFKEFEK